MTCHDINKTYVHNFTNKDIEVPGNITVLAANGQEQLNQ